MEMARTDDWVPMLTRVAELALQIAGTDLVPKAYRNDPDTVAAIILRGREIGLPPMTALAACYSINGRVGLYAEAQRALVLAAGHEIWFDDASGQSVTACGRRSGNSAVHRVTWTGDMARAAGLNTGPHKAYPRAMLKARASAELIRDVFPDVIGGFPAVEELQSIMDAETDVAAPALPVRRAKRSTPVRATPAEIDTAPPNWDNAAATAAPDESTAVPPITGKQVGRLQTLARDLGLDNRDERLSVAATELERPVESFATLDIAEASHLIDFWQNILEGNDTA